MLAFNAIAPLAQAMENTTYAAQAAWLCRGPTGPSAGPDRGVATITQTRVGKVSVNGPGGALATWVTNEDGTILGMRSGEGEISLDEEWGQAQELTGHAAYTGGTCSSPTTVDSYQKKVDAFMQGDGYMYTKATPTLGLSYSATNGRISLSCSGCTSPPSSWWGPRPRSTTTAPTATAPSSSAR